MEPAFAALFLAVPPSCIKLADDSFEKEVFLERLSKCQIAIEDLFPSTTRRSV